MSGRVEESVVVLLGRADLDAICCLEKQSFSRPWSRQQLQSAFDQDIYRAYGLTGSAGLIAYMSFYHVRPDMEILNLAVRPDCRGRGYARQLVLAVLQTGRDMGLERAFLEVAADNLAALGLYASLGFSQIGRRAGYYQTEGQDALLMARDL